MDSMEEIHGNPSPLPKQIHGIKGEVLNISPVQIVVYLKIVDFFLYTPLVYCIYIYYIVYIPPGVRIDGDRHSHESWLVSHGPEN